MQNPTVSVVVPLYRARKTVARLVKCLKDQTMDDFEAILVIDGTSGDGTTEEAMRAIGGDERFVVIEQGNAGPGVARNRGIEEACGEYIQFTDGDDTVSPKMLEHAVKRARETDADITIFQMELYDMQLKRKVANADKWDAASWPAVFDPADHADSVFGTFRNWPVDKLFKRSLLIDNGIRFPALRRSEDLAFTCTALACARSIALLDEPHYTYWVNNATGSTQNLDNAPCDFFYSARELKGQLEQRGLMALYSKAYRDWVALGICVTLLGMKSAEGFLLAYRQLHDGGLSELGIEPLPAPSEPRPVAGAVTDADVEHLIGVVAAEDEAAGAFLFGRTAADLVRRDYESSRVYRAARAISSLIRR